MLTQMQKIKTKLPDEKNEDVLEVYLDDAKMFILSRLYPFVNDYPKDDNGEYILPYKYSTLQVDIAVEMYSKMGAEGELSHSENGISRTYDNAVVSKELSNQIIPFACVIGD